MVVAVAVGLALMGPRVPVAASYQPSLFRQIGFEVDGAGQANIAAVYTRTQVIRFIPSRSTDSYDGAVAAVLTIQSKDGTSAWCRIRVDGVLVAEEEISGGGSATCLWVVGTEQLPRVTHPW